MRIRPANLRCLADDPSRLLVTTHDISDYRAWIGREVAADDVVHPGPVGRLSATLDRDDPPPKPGDALPPGWHWLYFLVATPAARLSEDGHTVRGDFLPPLPDARRMWAGGSIALRAPLRIGDAVRRTSRVTGIVPKEGRSGRLVFVTIEHQIDGPAGAAVRE